MVPYYGERRHRVSGRELPHVVTAVENQLREWLQYRRDEDRYGAMHLFRLWWRVQRHSVGKPSYPEPLTWGVIAEYLEPNDMEPKAGAEP